MATLHSHAKFSVSNVDLCETNFDLLALSAGRIVLVPWPWRFQARVGIGTATTNIFIADQHLGISLSGLDSTTATMMTGSLSYSMHQRS